MPSCVFIAYKTEAFPRQPLKSGARKKHFSFLPSV
jgi:hypothetical protein